MANEKRLIDANALLRRLQKRREDFAGAWKTLDAMPINAQIQYHENLECALIVEDIPIVDAVEVVHGRWISHNKGQNNWVECSECNTVGSPFWKRCPMCEAKMDGDGNA